MSFCNKRNVCCRFFQSGIGDANDIWKVLIVGGSDKEPVQTVTSKLLIVHCLQNCALTTSGKQLPKWGYEQQEVSCNPNVRDRNAFWNVEDNFFAKRKYSFISVGAVNRYLFGLI